jgi:hypothetical protein
MKYSKSFAARIREAGRRACREYCDQLPAVSRWPGLLLPCWKCQKCVGGKDCHGNEIGRRESVIAAARASVIELPPVVGYERKTA